MNINTVSQPETQLGNEIGELLEQEIVYPRIVFVSAFVALSTILRLRERLLGQVQDGANLRFTVGIDFGGTSREVLEELLRWDCETFVCHHPSPRATFHPKVYLFESATTATLFIGSNNLTDGGFYSNYEAATRYDFDLPADEAEYERLVRPLEPFLEPQGATVQQLNVALIATLLARGELPSDAEERQRRRAQRAARRVGGENVPESPFRPAWIPPLPPLLPDALRREIREHAAPQPAAQQAEPQQQPEQIGPQAAQPVGQPQPPVPPQPAGILVWRKKLTRSDASDVGPNAHPKAQVVLSQAEFESPPGHLINQTTYFRNLFRDFNWEPETGRQRQADQEHVFVPFRIFIRGQDYGVRNLEISHKPSGEADQANSPTVLRWGNGFNPIIRNLNLTGAILSLYEIADNDADFLINITDA
jgi:hypothetical protein